MIDRQLEMYRENPEAYVRDLPTRILGHFWERRPSRKISLAWLFATCLLATHRVPTASYIWKLMHRPNPDVPGDHGCQSAPNRDPGSASKRDAIFLGFERLALAPSELVGVAETARARVCA
jgi:hypothetical protein